MICVSYFLTFWHDFLSISLLLLLLETENVIPFSNTFVQHLKQKHLIMALWRRIVEEKEYKKSKYIKPWTSYAMCLCRNIKLCHYPSIFTLQVWSSKTALHGCLNQYVLRSYYSHILQCNIITRITMSLFAHFH